MATLAPVLGTILQVSSVLGTVASVAQPFLQDRVERKQLKQTNELQNQINAQAAAAETQRRDALKRAVARQRANFGAQGVGSGTGSSEAVLLGMFEQSDEEREAAETLNNLRTQAITQNSASAQQLNLLQQTQLRENQYVKYLSRIA